MTCIIPFVYLAEMKMRKENYYFCFLCEHEFKGIYVNNEILTFNLIHIHTNIAAAFNINHATPHPKSCMP